MRSALWSRKGASEEPQPQMRRLIIDVHRRCKRYLALGAMRVPTVFWTKVCGRCR